MKQENLKLRVELHRRKAKEVEFEKKINNLKDQLRQVEEDNKVLREFNNIFGQENKRLSAKLKRYQQHQIP
jgi:gamma-glutamyl:cysteine ligase YbdK (ATP-grasp superfamily)